MILKFHVKRDQMRVTEEHGQIGSNGVVVVGKQMRDMGGGSDTSFQITLPLFPPYEG